MFVAQRAVLTNEAPFNYTLVWHLVARSKKFVHVECFLGTIMATHSFEQLHHELVVCNKTSYKKNLSSTKEKQLTWENDGFHGPGDQNMSVTILIAWFPTKGNYLNSKSKRKVCEYIATNITSYIIRVKLDFKQVFNKIQQLERTFCDAYDFSKKEKAALV
jgi:hypothetical protein